MRAPARRREGSFPCRRTVTTSIARASAYAHEGRTGKRVEELFACDRYVVGAVGRRWYERASASRQGPVVHGRAAVAGLHIITEQRSTCVGGGHLRNQLLERPALP